MTGTTGVSGTTEMVEKTKATRIPVTMEETSKA